MLNQVIGGEGFTINNLSGGGGGGGVTSLGSATGDITLDGELNMVGNQLTLPQPLGPGDSPTFAGITATSSFTWNQSGRENIFSDQLYLNANGAINWSSSIFTITPIVTTLSAPSGILSGRNSGESAALPIPRYLSGSGSWSAGNVNTNTTVTQSFTLTGAKVGFPVVPTYTADLASLLSANPSAVVSAYCSTADNVILSIQNNSLINSFTPSGTFAFTIFQ